MSRFRRLNESKTAEFREWARRKFEQQKTGRKYEINRFWHPVIRCEFAKLIIEETFNDVLIDEPSCKEDL